MRFDRIVIGVFCLALGAGATKGLADITSWSQSAASNTSAVGTEGFSENAAPSTINDSARAVMAELAKFARQGVLSWFAPDGGIANAYYITPALTPTSAISGQKFSFKAGSGNTGPSTLRVGANAAKTIKKISNQDLAAGDIVSGGVYSVVDDGTFYQIQNTAVPTINAGSISSFMITNSAITFSQIASATAGSIVIFDATGHANVMTPGLVGQVPTSQGPNTVPIMQTPVTSSVVRGTAVSMLPAAASSNAAAAHGLSHTPDYLDVAIINKTAECGYSPGDVLPWNQGSWNAAGVPETLQIVKTSTWVKINTGSSFLHLNNATGGGDCASTAANWNIWVTPYTLN